jgi:hypothetical protein
MNPDKPKEPAQKPKPKPEPRRRPYPVDEPPDAGGHGSEPDYFPGKPAGGDLPKF